ncbi:unnamed protein product [Gordionus sp. m RMFG-2023]|uniref:sulfide:quinone oxidoreductase, mitochondrial-like isoform X2 n=1 Tax=Gordionus sp. m RMFG-2023 TaxID=3053472 RepID=UPI0030E1C5DE
MRQTLRLFADINHYKLVIAGGGSGGISAGSIFSRQLGKNQVAIIEPSLVHYYQPLWSLVGAGIKTFEESARSTASVMPKNAVWINDSLAKFDPENNTVITKSGQKISYDYMIVSLGLKLDFDKIKGLKEGLDDPNSNVCSNYSPLTVKKTFQVMKRLKQGNAVFTFPNTSVKCAGAAQKILYLTEDYTRIHGTRSSVNFHYMTPQPTIFMVPHYSKRLDVIIKERGINFHPLHSLVQVDDPHKEAKFTVAAETGKEGAVTYNYEMLHVTPPMSVPDVLKNSPLTDLKVNPIGYMCVDKDYLCSTKYSNIFGIGDCTDAPKSRTAAAIAGELRVLHKNLNLVMAGKSPIHKASGYSSCPIVISFNKCMLCEFDYDLTPIETFPVDQSIPRRSMMLIKKYILPYHYWNIFLKGYWKGPATIRKILHLGLKS